MKWIVKVERTASAFRINIPKKIVQKMCLDSSRYMVIDDRDDTKLILERMSDDSYEKADN